jgi:hypothetical protein
MADAIENAKGLPDDGYTLQWDETCRDSRRAGAAGKGSEADWRNVLNSDQREDGCVVTRTADTPVTLVDVPDQGLRTRESVLLSEEAGTLPARVATYLREARAAGLFPLAQSPLRSRDVLTAAVRAMIAGAIPWIVFLVGRWVVNGFVIRPRSG